MAYRERSKAKRWRGLVLEASGGWMGGQMRARSRPSWPGLELPPCALTQGLAALVRVRTPQTQRVMPLL
jgi:hypothetical protein